MPGVDRADDGFDLFPRDDAGAQDAGGIGRDGDDRAFDADVTRAAVDDGFDLALHIVDNVLCRSGAGLSGGVGGGRGERTAALGDQGARGGMGRQADRDGIESRADLVGDDGALFHDDGEGTRPERFGEKAGFFGKIGGQREALDVRDVRDMDDQGIVHRATLCPEDARDSGAVEGVGGKAVDRFCRHGDQASVSDDGGGGLDILLAVGQM